MPGRKNEILGAGPRKRRADVFEITNIDILIDLICTTSLIQNQLNGGY